MEYLCHPIVFLNHLDDFFDNWSERVTPFTYKYILDGSFSNLQHLFPKGQLTEDTTAIKFFMYKNMFHCFHVFLLKLCSIESIPLPNADYAFFDDEMPFTLI